MVESSSMVLEKMKEVGKPVKASELAELIGMDNKEVSKVFAELKKDSKIVSPKRCYYEPK